MLRFMTELNVLGAELQPCGTDPLTGFFRDGCCNTGPEDVGLRRYGFDVRAGGHDWAALKRGRDAYVLRLNGIYQRNLDKKNIVAVRAAARAWMGANAGGKLAASGGAG